jgi:hypothetical protein
MTLGKNLSRLIFGESESTKIASEEFDAVEISEGLTKVAEMPYNPSTYSSLAGMLKIASQCIDSLNEELQSNKNLVGEFEKKAEVRIIVDDMINNGLTDEYNVEDKISSLLEKDASELKIVREAVKLSADLKFGSLFEGIDKTASENITKRSMFDGML